MSQRRTWAGLRWMRTALSAMLAGSLLISGCSLTDIKNSAVKGVLGGIEATTKNWIDGLLPNVGEFFGKLWTNPVVPAPQ